MDDVERGRRRLLPLSLVLIPPRASFTDVDAKAKLTEWKANVLLGNAEDDDVRDLRDNEAFGSLGRNVSRRLWK